ncbi:MAG: MarR family transcriptional regulator [Lachnospiraceae bacterium]|nr:MarR family transcriptional regulator [Lachnospiraceae bacterium]
MTKRIPSTEIVQTFCATDRAHRAAVESQLSTLGIHRSQHMMLMYLYHCESTPSQAEMAKAFGISPAAVTGTIQKLEKAGFIERTMKNGREKEIAVSETGRAIVERTKKIFGDLDEAMCAGISDEELESFMGVLLRMQGNLRALITAE